jgi:hypothetical protein
MLQFFQSLQADPVTILAILLAAALAGGIIAHRLKQPVVLGFQYLNYARWEGSGPGGESVKLLQLLFWAWSAVYFCFIGHFLNPVYSASLYPSAAPRYA